MSDPKIEEDIEEIDEMWHFINKKNKKWIFKAFDRARKRVIVWVVGKRNSQTIQRLYEKLKHLKKCIFYTDHWKGFKQVLPANKHVIEKKHTIAIEQDNSGLLPLREITYIWKRER